MIREKSDPLAHLKDQSKMGPNARARLNTINAFSYKPEEIMKNAKQSQTMPVKLDKRKLKRIKEIELNHFTSKYCRKGKTGQSELPDYLKPFQEPPAMSDVKKLAKSVLNGTYDDQNEQDWINTIVYRNLPDHEKANFRAQCLKHLSLDYLDEVEKKR